MITKFKSAAYVSLLALLFACQQDDNLVTSTPEVVAPPEKTEVLGFYLLNEGMLNSNKATLDFYNYETGIYTTNIYAEANPTMVKEMGDVGNDIKIYGSKLYAVLNASNFIEVMDVKTAKHIATIPLENGRYIEFHNGKAYATSYNGEIVLGKDQPLGKVVEIDTTSLQITREVAVGYQPDELAIVNNNIFVANSGGYMYPDYDRTVSVVDIASFKEIKKIDVEVNLHRIKADNQGNVYVTSRGDYYDIASNLYVIDAKTLEVTKTFNVPVSNFTIVEDKLYYFENTFSYETFDYVKGMGIINTKTQTLETANLIDNAIFDEIETPYGIAVNPITKHIYITDAGNYVSTGFVYSFDANGNLLWKQAAGNIPAHFVFLYK
ncbi:YncE family protein [Flavobacterium agricola]|uniref:YncE family protein n=1 Tax=Flavobacterium agricola TaxID=2870839 RepID=A0ABY6M144_9FLAO|nr:DUF5074 domain-containing protein [Flavobacterium agricola]UYW02270.1 YncE family protein [Flavobacterium agricola]